MTVRHTAQEIDLAAAAWAARLDRGALTPEEDRRLEAWLAEDPRHAGAFGKAWAVALSSQRARALGPGFRPEAPGPDRRRFLWGAAAAGFGGAAIAVGLPSYGRAYATGLGEMKVVPLADGSVISLNTRSRVRVRYSAAQRLVHLERGEALFEVVPDATRPFVVRAMDREVAADATTFTVRRLDETHMQVLVREGHIDLSRAGHTEGAVRAGANSQVMATDAPQGPVARVEPYPVERALMWREGRIAFEGEPLKVAAAAFRRYSDTLVRIDDPVLAEETVTGLFQSNDPVGFARAVASGFGARVEVSEKQVRLYR